MSFILDALKKSEIERQRQSVPGLMESGMVRPRPRLPVWAIALAALLAINLIVLLVVLTRAGSSAARIPATGSPSQVASPGDAKPAPGVRPADVPAAQRSAAAEGHFSPLDAQPVYAPEIPVSGTEAGTAPVPAARLQSNDADLIAAHPLHRRDPLLTDDDYKADDEETLPSINEINLTGAQALPELHLDVHVFATKSAERFVYINMRKYHEGATLQEGPTVERIRRDGVILDFHGLRFLLPRQ
jgi:general secretion pathway protein B